MSGSLLKAALTSVLLIATAATAQTLPPQPGQPAPRERRICRVMDQPGALAGSRRVCMTRAEWERQAEQARRDGAEMIAGRDSCGSRAEGGTQIGGGPGQQTAAAMTRMMGC